MVTINFRLSDAGSHTLKLTETVCLAELLEKFEHIDLRKGDYIAVRNGRVITDKERLADNDTVDIFPALSGG